MKHEYKILYVPPSGMQQLSQHAWIASLGDQCVGHIHMQIEAENRIKFLDAWVDEDHRRKGMFRKLWNIRWDYVNENYKGWKAYAWAKPMSLPLLLEKGFEEGDNCIYVEKDIK